MSYEMIYCRNCYSKIPANSVVCPECGETIESNYIRAENEELFDIKNRNNEEDMLDQTTLLEYEHEAETPGWFVPPAESDPFDNTTILTAESGTTNEPVRNNDGGEKMSYLDFYNRYTEKQTKNWVVAACVLVYISLAVDLLVLIGTGNIFAFLDVAVFAICGTLLLMKKEYIYSLILTVYLALATIFVLINGGGVTGVVALVCCVMSTVNLKKVKDKYKTYVETGII